MTSATPGISGVDFATVFVKDYPAAVEFYGGTFSDPDGNTLMLHHRYAPRD
jgi:hypothetical protein